MKDAASAAGYKGRSGQALCNSGRKVLNKLSENPKSIFYWPGAREMKIARLIVDTADNGTVQQQLEALKILVGCYCS